MWVYFIIVDALTLYNAFIFSGEIPCANQYKTIFIAFLKGIGVLTN
jgi:hypothetical protein